MNYLSKKKLLFSVLKKQKKILEMKSTRVNFNLSYFSKQQKKNCYFMSGIALRFQFCICFFTWIVRLYFRNAKFL